MASNSRFYSGGRRNKRRRDKTQGRSRRTQIKKQYFVTNAAAAARCARVSRTRRRGVKHGRFTRVVYAKITFPPTCRRRGRIRIVRIHRWWCWKCRRCRSGVVVVAAAVPRRFQIVASRFVAGCRPSWIRVVTSTYKNIILKH